MAEDAETGIDEARRTYLTRKWSAKLAHRSKSDHSFPEEGEPLAVLSKADPSPRKEYMDWICRVYCRGEFLAEDVERVRNTLVLFHRWKHRLPSVERDIGRHRSEQSVWACVEKFDPLNIEDLEPEGRELRRRERAKALAESDVCDAEGMDGWILASPQTKFASVWWGRGTRWCTAMANGNHFGYYTKSGPLRVFVDPEGKKFQAHAATGSCCDSQDKRIDFANFVDRIPEPARNILREDVKRLLPAIEGVVKLSHDVSLILSLPVNLVPEEVSASLKAKGLNLITTLAEDGPWKLSYAHEALSKWALGLRTAANSPYGQSNFLILEGGESRMVAETSDKSVAGFRSLLSALKPAPEGFRTKAVDRLCVLWEGKNGYRNPAWMPSILETMGVGGISRESWQVLAQKVAKMARSWCDFAIPHEAIDDEVADILATGWSLTALPEGMVTKQRLMTILSKHPELVKTEVPALGLAHMVDDEVAMAMVSHRCGEGLQHVPEELLTKDFMVRALERFPKAVKHAPPDILTYEICLAVVSLDGTMVMEIPRQYRDREMFLRAATQNGGVLHFVPEAMRDVEICRAALAKNPDQFPHAVGCDLRYENYLAGVAMSGSLLARVPLQFRDEAMCLAAVGKQYDAIYHIPPLLGERLKAAHPEKFEHYRGQLSSRYKSPDDPIRTFLPEGEMPETLPPVPALAA